MEQPNPWHAGDNESFRDFENETENISIFPRFFITRFLIFTCIDLYI